VIRFPDLLEEVENRVNNQQDRLQDIRQRIDLRAEDRFENTRYRYDEKN
jgi:hypothetical protein